jgi:hypothetical protein
LKSDVVSGGADRSAESDFASAFEDGDDHRVGDADAADQKRDRAEREQQSGEDFIDGGAGGECVGSSVVVLA